MLRVWESFTDLLEVCHFGAHSKSSQGKKKKKKKRMGVSTQGWHDLQPKLIPVIHATA